MIFPKTVSISPSIRPAFFVTITAVVFIGNALSLKPPSTVTILRLSSRYRSSFQREAIRTFELALPICTSTPE